MSKARQILTSWKVLLLIVVVAGAIIAIGPRFGVKGVLIKSVEPNSTAAINGMKADEVITRIDGQRIADLADWSAAMASLEPGIVRITTDEDQYSLVVKENVTDLGLVVKDVPTTNLKQGLDLVGGVRVLLQPAEAISAQQLDDTIEITKRRLNVYGLADVVVRQVKDLEGNQYVLVEVAGATREGVRELIGKQGKFEAKIRNATIFIGGKDIKDVCRSAECSGIDPRVGCGQVDSEWQCRFQFRVDVSPESAKRHSEATASLLIITKGGQRYLNESLDLYLDDILIDSLLISADLKGQEATTFVIEGPGSGSTKEAAINDALASMKKLQTVLITGSMPVKLDIARMDAVSPTLGKNFLKYAMITILIAIAVVGSIVFIRFRKIKVTGLIVSTMLCEVVIILGIAALIKWNLDLAAIAGIIAAIGTGVDHQIIITDETLGGAGTVLGWKERIKRAFFIITGAYFTTVVAMIPLYAMGAGLLRGFAIITIIGITIGVFITRPAYAQIIEVLSK